jgi:hypothetical protein
MAGPSMSLGAALMKPGAMAAPKKPGAADQAQDDQLLVPAQDLIDAVKSGDAQLVADALRAAHTICQSDYGEEATEPGQE